MERNFIIEATRDAELVGKLARDIWPGVYGRILSPGQLEYMLEMMYSPEVMRREMDEGGIKFYLAREDGRPVGFASFGPYAGNEAKLHKLYLLEQARGRGYGRKLLEFISSAARDDSYKFLRLNVNRNNTGSVAAYLACGFEKYLKVDVPIGNGFFMNDHIMRKTL